MINIHILIGNNSIVSSLIMSYKHNSYCLFIHIIIFKIELDWLVGSIYLGTGRSPIPASKINSITL